VTVTPDLTIVLAAFAGAAVSPLWVAYHRRRDERLAVIASCGHIPGDVYPVKGSSNSYKRECIKCGAQQHCHRDGKPWERNDGWH